MNLFSNPDWQFIINFIGIFLAVLPLILSIKFPFKKAIDLAYQDCKVEKEIQTNDGGKNYLNSATIMLFNFGHDVIYQKDIHDNFILNLKSIMKIENLKVESTCKYNSIITVIETNQIKFSFNFLEPNEYIRIQIKYYSSEKINASLKGKIIGGDEIETSLNPDQSWENRYWIGRKEMRAFNAKLFVIIGLSMITSVTFARMFKLNIADLNKMIFNFDKTTLLVSVIGLFFLFIFWLIGERIGQLYLPFASHAKKIKNWHHKN